MKRIVLAVLAVALLAGACSKKQEAVFEKGSKEYEFFKNLAAKQPLLDPDQSQPLIKTTAFTVTTKDVLPNLYRLLSGHAAQMQNMNKEQLLEFLRQSARREAEKRLFLAAAVTNNVTVPDDSVEAQLEKIYAMYGGKENFVNHITSQGLTLDFVKQDIKDNMTIQKYFKEVVYKNLKVTDQDLKKVYNEGKTATVRHILLLTQGKSDSAKKEIYKKMEGILKEARSGKDFAELAKKYSEDPGSRANGGLYEKFPHGKMVKPFEDAAFSLPIGSISDIIETQYGYHILKVIGREKYDKPFDQEKPDLERMLMNIKKREAVYTVLDSLKKEYKYEELLPAA